MDNELKNKIYLGVVEDIKDPNRKGRIKVRVQGIYDSIPLEDIPYASPYRDLAGKEFKLPAVGKAVNILFPNGDMYDPHYIYSENYNINLQNKLKELSEEEYKNFVALLFDHRTQIYSDDTALTLDYKYNKITLDNENINLELKDNRQKLKIGTKSASQQAMLGNHWLDWFDELVQILQNPVSLTGNLGAPIIRPELDAHLIKYQTLRKTFISEHVWIVDNKKVDKLE